MKKYVVIHRFNPKEQEDYYYFLYDFTRSPGSEIVLWGYEFRDQIQWPVSFVEKEIEFQSDNIHEIVEKYWGEFL